MHIDLPIAAVGIHLVFFRGAVVVFRCSTIQSYEIWMKWKTRFFFRSLVWMLKSLRYAPFICTQCNRIIGILLFGFSEHSRTNCIDWSQINTTMRIPLHAEMDRNTSTNNSATSIKINEWFVYKKKFVSVIIIYFCNKIS